MSGSTATSFQRAISEAIRKEVAAGGGTYGFTSLYELCEAFIYAVNWNETWILALLAFYVVLFVAAVLTRKHWQAQFFFLCLSCGLVLSAESLNDWAGHNWRRFATQNYFDSTGLFASIMFATPLLMTALFVLLYGLYETGSLLIQVKRKEFAKAKKDKLKAERDKNATQSSASPNIPSSSSSTETQSTTLRDRSAQAAVSKASSSPSL